MQTCDTAVADANGEQSPCGRPILGWQWYQGVDHEPGLFPACISHANEGGRRMYIAESMYGPCECDTSPDTDGADETCPRHGRTYAEWVEIADQAATRAYAAEEAIARVRALHGSTSGWCPICDPADQTALFPCRTIAALTP